MIQHKGYIAICSSLLLLLPVMSVQGERLIESSDMKLSISTDKKSYYPGEVASYTVKFLNSNGNLVDPDLIRATYNSQFIELDKVGEGIYKYTTNRLTQRDHQLGVYAEKDGFNFVQQSLTIRPIATQLAKDNVKASAVQQGDILKFRVSNSVISKSEIYKVRLTTIGAGLESVASGAWIKVPNHIGMDLKSVYGSIGPGEKQTVKLLVNGEISKVVWTAFDMHGKQIYSGVARVA